MLQQFEVEPYAEFVGGVGGDTHHAAHADPLHGCQCTAFDVFQQRVVGPSRLGLLVRDVDFEQNVDYAAVADRLVVDYPDEPFAVGRMDQRDEGGDELYLVGLQVPDHVPFDVLGQRFVFCSQLLRPALAEDALSCGVSLFDEGRGVRFGYGHQRDAFGQCLPHVR